MERENYEKLSDLIDIIPLAKSDLLKYLCPLCYSMVDEENPFYKAGGCCSTFYICHSCYKYRVDKIKRSVKQPNSKIKICPNP